MTLIPVPWFKARQNTGALRDALWDIDLPWSCATPNQYQMQHVEACYYEITWVTHRVLRLFVSVFKSGSLLNKVHKRVKTLVYRAVQLLTTSGKIVLPGGCSCVRRPPNNQSIHRFSITTWFFCVILGWSDPDEWWGWWWSVSTSVSGCLECLQSNIAGPRTFNTTQASQQPVTHPMWFVRKEISSSLRTWVDSWTLRLNF